jgi:hypothetical protein
MKLHLLITHNLRFKSMPANDAKLDSYESAANILVRISSTQLILLINFYQWTTKGCPTNGELKPSAQRGRG